MGMRVAARASISVREKLSVQYLTTYAGVFGTCLGHYIYMMTIGPKRYVHQYHVSHLHVLLVILSTDFVIVKPTGVGLKCSRGNAARANDPQSTNTTTALTRPSSWPIQMA